MAESSATQQKFLAEFEAWSKRKYSRPLGAFKHRSQVAAPHGYAVVDVETTGTDHKTPHGSGNGPDRIVQIAISRCDQNGVSQERFVSLVNPGARMPSAEATAVHHITEQMLVGAPRFDQLVDTITPLLDGNVFTAFNTAFDLPMLQHEFQLARYMYSPVGEACLLKAYRLMEPDLETHKLESWAQVHGHVFQAHDAGEDVRISELLLQELIDQDIAPETVELDEDLWIRKQILKEPDKPASEKSIRYLFVLARKLGWLYPDSNSVDSRRVKRLCAAINDGCQIDQMTTLQQARMADAFTFIAIRKAKRELKHAQELAHKLNAES